MDEFPLSDESAGALTKLAGVIDRLVPGNGLRDELTSAIMELIDARLADAIEALADRLEKA